MSVTIANWPKWFATFWPSAQRRWLVITGYRALATHHKDTLADIAVRNHVFAPIREADAHRAAIAEGRRQCALEIFQLAQVDPKDLFDRIERNTRNNGDRR